MSFSSLDFLVLMIVTFSLYYFPPLRKWQVLVLIAASFVFYGYLTGLLL